MEFGKYIAHRGLYGKNIPENSIPAFVRAAEKGFAAELDVRLSKDGKIVVFHDSDLMRMCGVEGRISDFTYRQLTAFRLGNSNERIPLLKDVLKAVNGRIPLLIEIKDGSPVGSLEKRVYKLMRSCKTDQSYAIESFNPFSVMWFRIYAPEVRRGQLISVRRSKTDLKYIARRICALPIVWKLISSPDFIADDLRCVSVKKMLAASDINAKYVLWTARSDADIKMSSYFTDKIIFENYDGLSYDLSDNRCVREEMQ